MSLTEVSVYEKHIIRPYSLYVIFRNVTNDPIGKLFSLGGDMRPYRVTLQATASIEGNSTIYDFYPFCLSVNTIRQAPLGFCFLTSTGERNPAIPDF